ncbi:hypothetical protein QBC38DRAFT_471155 [Podospora fimiseda]|uniref:Eisosome protein 1 n=1 Tax=Podospora fimiseda TaxID=252190 RepID=A0AAN7GYR6_9PEZI|nr:hypothetical protein QBC38DRAFT_471155 [Podospora fimiseda]
MTSESLTTPGVAQGQRPILPNNSGRLKYANAQDLPSYPSAGLKEGSAAASAAATLGWAKRTVVEEPRKPHANTLASASAAALLAADNKSLAKHRETQTNSAAGSQAAFAASSSVRQHRKQPSTPTSLWGSSAANLAFKGTKSSSPQPTIGTANLARQNSMRAAQGAMTGRPRANSTPNIVQPDPDQATAATSADALKAATLAHKPFKPEVGAVPYTTMGRKMFTSRPPVKPEMDEQERAEVLHASAVAMARKMFDQQQKIIDSTTKTHQRSSSFPRQDKSRPLSPDHDEEHPPVAHGTLQEAAYRLAQERLAKLQAEHDQNRDLNEYYGTPNRTNTRLGSIRGKLTRRRSSSDGDLVEDQRRSQHIKKQMTMLSTQLTQVDEEKRTKDRQALLAAAQRNVQAQLHDMDEKLQAESGRVPQSTMGEWERKALVAAQTRFDVISNANSRKVDIGGGKFMDQEEVNRIAAKKVQPLLDEINQRAEQEHERQEREKLEEEKRKLDAEREKQRQREIEEIYQRLKEDERARAAEIKKEDKIHKEEVKAVQAEQKRVAKEEKQKEKEVVAPTPAANAGGTQTQNNAGQPANELEIKTAISSGRRSHALSISFPRRKQKGKDVVVVKPGAEKSPKSAGDSTSPTHKVRTWLRNRLPTRQRAKSQGAENSASRAQKSSFIGGAALARLQGRNVSTPSIVETLEKPKYHSRSSSANTAGASMREVALAGRKNGEASGSGSKAQTTYLLPSPMTPTGPASPRSQGVSEKRSVSSISSDDSTTDKFVEARSHLASPLTPLTPPRLVGLSTTGRASPFRESRFSENLE